MPKHNPKILVVDDERDIVEFFKSYFKRRGYEVFIADSGEKALSIIKQENPKLILLDINLPGMSGIELVKHLRTFNSTIKIILVSGYDLDTNTGSQLKDLDISKFLHKPITPSELEKVVAEAIN